MILRQQGCGRQQKHKKSARPAASHHVEHAPDSRKQFAPPAEASSGLERIARNVPSTPYGTVTVIVVLTPCPNGMLGFASLFAEILNW